MLHRMMTPLPAEVDSQDKGKFLARILRLFLTSLHFLYILVWLELGMVLLLLPWRQIWENNYLLYRYPQFHPLVANPFFKGFVLGLGIANILIGINEIGQLRQSWKEKQIPR
jgi:hypothetical protein